MQPDEHEIDSLREVVVNDYIAKFETNDGSSINIHVVRYFDCFIEANNICLVSEFCNV